MKATPCTGCGWCCLSAQCDESHILHGYLKRCPELYFDGELNMYRCRLAANPQTRGLLGMGQGCWAPLNPWRDDVRRRDEDE